METNSSGSAILYLELEIYPPQKKCLSVINLDKRLKKVEKKVVFDSFLTLLFRLFQPFLTPA